MLRTQMSCPCSVVVWAFDAGSEAGFGARAPRCPLVRPWLHAWRLHEAETQSGPRQSGRPPHVRSPAIGLRGPPAARATRVQHARSPRTS
ncbi:hypothetical protein N9L68_09235, partial [bacterium]|nr:hypothetical protein [bacterium]